MGELFSSEFFPFLPIGAAFPGFSQDSFEKRQVAAFRSSKEFCASPRSSSTNRRKGTAHFFLQKSFVNLKGSGVKGTGT